MQNIIAAGIARKDGALGIHLTFVETICEDRVEKVLREVEQKYPSVGSSLVTEFFPGGLRAKDDDLAFWQKAMSERLGPNRHGTRIDFIPPAASHSASDLRSGEDVVN